MATTSFKVFVLNTLDMPVHVAVVRHSAYSMHFVVSPRRVPIPSGEVMTRDTIAPGEAFAAENVPPMTVPLVERRGFDRRPVLTLTHAKKDDVRVLIFRLKPTDAPEET